MSHWLTGLLVLALFAVVPVQAAPAARDLAGCWDLREAEVSPIDPPSICFDNATEISTVVMGWGEGFGGEGKYRRSGDRIEFSGIQWEAWPWSGEGQDRFSCTFTLTAADEFTISECSKGVPDQVFIKVPEDARVRGFHGHREGSAAEVASALTGCWDWTTQLDYYDAVSLCFSRNGLLRLTQQTGPVYGYEGPITTMVRDAHYRIAGERLMIERPGGAGWFFHAAKFDCDVVIKPGVKLRLAACSGVRHEDGKEWPDFSFGLFRHSEKKS